MKSIYQSLRSLFYTATSSCILALSSISPSLAGGVELTNYGHSSILIKGGGKSVLINPFKAVGCAKGLLEPHVSVDVILASSLLADEGAKVAKGIFLVTPGSYQIGGTNFEGFSSPHDRLGGRRFGQTTIWQWQQAGLNFAHLGGAASPLKGEEKVLIGRPDVLIIAVGGGAKVFNGLEAAQVVSELKPKNVIPVQYLINDDSAECDLTGVAPFLEAMQEFPVRKVGKTFSLRKSSNEGTVINIMR